MQHSWQSVSIIQKLYRSHTITQFVLGIALAAVVAALLYHFLYFSVLLFPLGVTGINFLFILCIAVWCYAVISYLVAWGRKGFRLSTFTERWEHRHPEVFNRTSMMVYAARHPDEVERLGYSKDLLASDDRWLQKYLDDSILKEDDSGYNTIAAVAVIVGLVTFGMYAFHLWDVQVLGRISQALNVTDGRQVVVNLTVPESISVERGKPVVLTARSNGALREDNAYVHLGDHAAWQTISAQVQDRQITFTIPSVHRQLTYYFSNGQQVSNQGRIVPLDAPTISQGTVTIEPPQYTGLPKDTLNSLRPFAVPEGSFVQVVGKPSAELQSAEFYLNDNPQPTVLNTEEVAGSFAASESGEFYFRLKDMNNLTGESQRIRVTVVKDATPTVEIINPSQISDVPDLLVLRVSAHVKDDYRIEKVIAHSQLNNRPETHRADQVWEYSPEKAREVGSATEMYITFDWDLAQMGLFPGDEMTFYMEVWDNDQINGSKSGRSQTHTLRYPSLVDMLSDLEESERRHVDDLTDITDKQGDITRDAQDTIEKIEEKLEKSPFTDEAQDEFWMEKQELEQLKERQEELLDEARKIEEELSKFHEQAEQNLSAQEKMEQGFTPETLEKMDKIRELLSELIDKDSQRLLQKLEQTIEQLSKDISPQQLQDLSFSFQDFDEQLNRTLSMLENTQQMRQLESLQQMAQELAERQDHLQRETKSLAEQKAELERELAQLEGNKPQDGEQPDASGDQPEGEQGQTPDEQGEMSEEMKAWQEKKDELQKKLDELATKEQLLAERQNRLQEETQSMMDKMSDAQENIQEQNPTLAQQLQNMQDQMREQGLQQEMRQASQQLQQGQPQQAQPHQQKAQEQLQQLAQQMQMQMADMEGMNMEMDTKGLKRLVDRGLFLSNEMEPLTDAQSERNNPQMAIRRAQAFLRETNRVESEWKNMAQTNPFLSRDVQNHLRLSQERLRTAIQAGQGEKWVGVHEGRQSLIALNNAIYNMMQDMQQMMQQQQQSSMQSMQQQMQQMISQQQNIQQMLQQMRQMGEQGQQMLEQLQKMAQRQAQVRKELEKMMQQHRHAERLRNQLDGIYQEMKDVEDLMEKGINDEVMDEKQQRIMTRMLEAGTAQEKDELGNERKAQTAKTGTQGASPEENVPMSLKERLQEAVDRPAEENIPIQYREAIKNHFLHLSEQLAQ